MPAKAGQPLKAAWALRLVVEDVAADGSHMTRMKARGAIATAATHGPQPTASASPPARPLASRTCQVAVKQEGAPHVLSAAHCNASAVAPVTLTVHNVTTARDLVPPRKGETRRRTLGERRTGLASNNTRTKGG